MLNDNLIVVPLRSPNAVTTFPPLFHVARHITVGNLIFSNL